jgi:hypothetical protein
MSKKFGVLFWSALMMVAASISSETSANIYQTTHRNIPKEQP